MLKQVSSGEKSPEEARDELDGLFKQMSQEQAEVEKSDGKTEIKKPLFEENKTSELHKELERTRAAISREANLLITEIGDGTLTCDDCDETYFYPQSEVKRDDKERHYVECKGCGEPKYIILGIQTDYLVDVECLNALIKYHGWLSKEGLR